MIKSIPEQLEAIKRIMNKPEDDEVKFIMPFGHYIGRNIREVPMSYLKALMTKDVNENIYYIIEEEIDRRYGRSRKEL